MNFFTGKTPIWSQGDIPLALAIAPDGLAVAPTGKRYTNEYMLDHFNTWMAGPYYYTIWSDTQLQAIKEQGFDWNADGPCFGWLGCQCPIPAGVPMTQMDEVIAAALEAGILWEADSIEALAGKIGVDGDALAQTVASYNSYVDAGEDPEFGKAPEFLDSKVEGGRYYALKAVSYCYTIGGGLHVDTSLRVLDAGGQPIEGRYRCRERALFPQEGLCDLRRLRCGLGLDFRLFGGRDSRRIGQRRVSAVLKEFTK